MDFSFSHTIEFDNSSIEFHVQVKGYSPGRPAPACDNPSLPEYSDPGEPSEFDSYDISIIIENTVFNQDSDEKSLDMYFIPIPDESNLHDAIREEIVEEVFTKADELFKRG